MAVVFNISSSREGSLLYFMSMVMGWSTLDQGLLISFKDVYELFHDVLVVFEMLRLHKFRNSVIHSKFLVNLPYPLLQSWS